MHRQRGFTLIELMVVVAVVAILAAVAYPSYRDYVLRGNVAAATAELQALRADMERHYQNNRTYASVTGGASTPCGTSRTVGNFTLSCDGTPTATAFSIQAVGDGFTFKLNQLNVRATTAGPWGTCATAWTLKRGQAC
ncbi:prepilin-type N-terminal cleavage/methylation domain-containing protein [Xenophilus arseniciresistens]|uniref:Prepilin-type N-terminal cleavage/methylation domain-containing protein n=1 Tax=Xenophilus arseniciresistens TaxID=1283306 RepID=A0AAE3N4X8_9BURK|nr:type IV pilin protein [Xenophilus arseniciresistens]MDA7414983.1 prepilin-type N-terminal cleavage/methylation domain-containing protein [Xenophilus arseniciresistens]